MKKSIFGKLFICLFLLAAVGAGVFYGAQYFTKTGLFKEPNVSTYDDYLTKSGASEDINKAFCQTEDECPIYNVSVSATFEFNGELKENQLVYKVLVPVVDYYSTVSNITSAEVQKIFDGTEDVRTDVALINVNDLTASQRLISIDGNYYLDDFNSGALWYKLSIESDELGGAKATLATYLEDRQPTFTKDNTLSLAQTGVTALSRGMGTKLNQVGDGAYFAAKIKDFLSSKDLTHISNEVSFYDNCNIASGATTLCAKPAMIESIKAIGTDIVELTGNHNRDYGDTAANETIDLYNELGYKIFGGGKTADEAAQALAIEEKGNNIVMLGYNYSTGGYTNDNTPGANEYTEEKAAADITAAKATGATVIVDVQYFECYCYPDYGQEYVTCDSPDWGYNQRGFFRHLIDLGADIVVGTSAHQPQSYELYGDGAIYYGLGNLFFDQTYWPGTTRGLILTHYFNNGKLVQTRINPTVYDTDLQVRLMTEEETTWLLTRLVKSR